MGYCDQDDNEDDDTNEQKHYDDVHSDDNGYEDDDNDDNIDMKEMLYEVRCLKSNEDMILTLAGQFKQLSHEPEKFRWLNGIRTHDLYDAGAVL